MRFLLISFLCIIVISCNNAPKKVYRHYEGPIQGTWFNITYEWHEDLAMDIDSLLQNFNKSLSNYDKSSVVYKINYNESDIADELFVRMFNTALDVYEQSDGAFDISIAPVANLWGFGWNKMPENHVPDSAEIIESLKYVGMNKLRLEGDKIIKDYSESMIITNAIAQGLSVDYVSDYLFKIGVRNFLVEIGGEIYCYGKNNRNEIWRIGIDKPISGSNIDERANQIIINISDKAIATSGDYRKYIESGGQKFGHSINPLTGFPAQSNLLSATVIADNCMLSDAWATAFMVMGFEKSFEIASKNNAIDAYFIYTDESGNEKSEFTQGFEKFMDK